MCLVAQIATFVLGIIALVKGEVMFTKNHVVRGPRARWIHCRGARPGGLQ